MDLKDIASISGKPGLFKVLKPTRTGVILETIDQAKGKLIANGNNRVSLLKEISVYTTSKEASLPLEAVFKNIYDKYGRKLNVNPKSEENELRNFLSTVVPDYDTERVYQSDIKKMVSWYSILMEFSPEVFTKEPEPEKKEEVKETPKKEVKAEEKKVEKKEPEKKEVKAEKKEEKKEPRKKVKKEAKKETKKTEAKSGSKTKAKTTGKKK
ncbi:MAG: DUF5606 domain-containing protein [Cytophagaceae bacterium]|nr:DUF5606 domain-containing protein [Cytophagaceae bacterium]